MQQVLKGSAHQIGARAMVNSRTARGSCMIPRILLVARRYSKQKKVLVKVVQQTKNSCSKKLVVGTYV